MAFAVTDVGFVLVASRMPELPARKLALAASALSVLSTLLWLPIAARRLAIGRRVDALISERPKVVNIGGRMFWPYTLATLSSILLMSLALVISGLHRRTVAIGAAVSGAAILLLRVFRDWPPFLSYLITLAIGLRLASRRLRG